MRARTPSRLAVPRTFISWDGDTLVLNVLGKPGASRDAIGKVRGHQLQVSVTAAPRVGRATDHMVRFLRANSAFPVATSKWFSDART